MVYIPVFELEANMRRKSVLRVRFAENSESLLSLDTAKIRLSDKVALDLERQTLCATMNALALDFGSPLFNEFFSVGLVVFNFS